MRRLSDSTTVAAKLRSNPGHADLPAALFELLAEHGALLEGHFALQSGEHSPYFLRFQDLGWNVTALRAFAGLLHDRQHSRLDVDLVLCSASAGFFFAAVCARLIDRPLAVLAADLKKRPLDKLQSGSVPREARVLIVADVITKGKTVEALVRYARNRSAHVAGVFAFASLHPDLLQSYLRRERMRGDWLLESAWDVYDSSQCPLCREHREPAIPAFVLA